MNKKVQFLILSGALVFIGYLFLHPSHVLADVNPYQYNPDPIGLPDVVSSIVSLMWYIFSGLTVIMFIVAGVLFMTAQGDPEKLRAARSSVIWGVVGIVVAIIAYSILSILGNALECTLYVPGFGCLIP